MSLKAKYEKVLELGKEFGVKDGYVEEQPGKLKIGGVAETQYQKDKMWDEIKRAGGESPADIEADIIFSISYLLFSHVCAKCSEI